jgi:hypothetical protein
MVVDLRCKGEIQWDSRGRKLERVVHCISRGTSEIRFLMPDLSSGCRRDV